MLTVTTAVLLCAACSVEFTGPCSPNPCVNDGVCTVTDGTALCDCQPGFVGDLCETNVDDCDPNPCENGGTCTDFVNTFTCDCPAGYSGLTCETNIDDCDPDPCEHGGVCTDGANQFSCACVDYWTGPTCAEDSCVSRDLPVMDCSSNAPAVTGNRCARWTDGDESTLSEMCCADGSPADISCVPDGTAGCNTPEGCVRDLWVGQDLGAPHTAVRLRFQSDWWGKAPDVYEVWTSNSATEVPDSGATLVAVGTGTPRPWVCVTGESCAPETVPEACCPNGRDEPQDTINVGDWYAKYDFLDLPPTEGRYWYLMVRNTQWPQCIAFRDITFIGSGCTE